MVGDRKPAEYISSRAGVSNDYLTPILFARAPDDVPAPFQAIDQFHRAVMLELETAGELADRSPGPRRKSPDGEQKLMLLGFQAVSPDLLLAEVEETPDLTAKFS